MNCCMRPVATALRSHLELSSGTDFGVCRRRLEASFAQQQILRDVLTFI